MLCEDIGMKDGTVDPRSSAETRGLWYGFFGVVGFSLTLPATRVAVTYFDPVLVGLGRALVAAVLAAVLLAVTRQAWPARVHLKGLLIVVAGAIVGFPLLSSWAMREVPAAHAAIVIGIVPLATALAAVFRTGERPSLGFWLTSVLGGATVITFTLMSGAGQLQAADILLLMGVAAVALGYAEGGRLAQILGGWQVICWALVIAAPLLLVPVGWVAWQQNLNDLQNVPWSAWLAFGYVSVISQWLAFFLWYHGMALGGVARVSQMQLLQPFLTLMAAGLFLGESVTGTMLMFALAVVAIVAVGKNMPVVRGARKK